MWPQPAGAPVSKISWRLSRAEPLSRRAGSKADERGYSDSQAVTGRHRAGRSIHTWRLLGAYGPYAARGPWRYANRPNRAAFGEGLLVSRPNPRRLSSPCSLSPRIHGLLAGNRGSSANSYSTLTPSAQLEVPLFAGGVTDTEPRVTRPSTSRQGLAQCRPMRVQGQAAPDAAKTIAQLTRRRRPVVFVGAGISARSGLPLARDIKNEMFCRVAHGIGEPSDSGAQERWQQRLDGVMLESLVEVFARQAPGLSRTFASVFRHGRPNDAHHALAAQLATKTCSAIITTNFDDLIERAYERLRRDVPNTPPLAVVRTRRDRWDGERPLLVKLHGCVRKPHTIAITLTRVGKGLEAWKCAWLQQLAKAPFLMCGYSDQDKDISPVLMQLKNDWIWLLHYDRQIGDHVPRGSGLHGLLSKPGRTVLLTDASATLMTWSQHSATTGATVMAGRVAWSTTLRRVVARIPRDRRCIILGDILCELLGDDNAADRAYRRGLRRRGLSLHLRVELFSRRARLLGEVWALDEADHLLSRLVRIVTPVHALSPRDRATVERLRATLQRKRATRLSQEAEESLRRAESLSASIGDRENEALAQMNRAVVLQKRGRYKAAEPLYEKVLRAFRKQGNLSALGKTLVNYGSLLGMTGRNPLALRAYREAAQAFELIGDPLWAARLRVNMAIVLRELRQPKRALPLALAARDTIRRHGDRYWTFNAEQAVSNVRRDIRYGWHP